ncbi:hypothetical protein Mp_1g07790 [Marchantia polymorpha subsp. ruderalis]|uniref:Uncharacterized protein n=2 Tax=Marchantia polymorpha TaxID=3197 RepID=A0AAF6AMP3_MARPO|nr:hypothetical protein MARPO_0036s0023 [Marchantia polymorpha]BBM97713.1 hypothetical protein Mp_1g07790 [Marchantia polymorpha subsp. ruderalis]|eukprot:PTQ41016.1 hypothetical protein MARPO_0036s0023 [Marchantia polymorpha]
MLQIPEHRSGTGLSINLTKSFNRVLTSCIDRNGHNSRENATIPTLPPEGSVPPSAQLTIGHHPQVDPARLISSLGPKNPFAPRSVAEKRPPVPAPKAPPFDQISPPASPRQ